MIRIAAVAALTVTLACAGSSAERTTPGEPRVRPAGSATGDGSRMTARSDMSRMCPMDVPGTTIAASDTPEGEALTFTTRSGQVEELRRRVRALADMHNQHMATAPAAPRPGEAPGTGAPPAMTGGPTADDGTGGGDAHHGHRMMPPPSRATVEDVENGARVTIAPIDPSQADQLRVVARRNAARMQQHGCGMVHGGATPR